MRWSTAILMVLLFCCAMPMASGQKKTQESAGSVILQNVGKGSEALVKKAIQALLGENAPTF